MLVLAKAIKPTACPSFWGYWFCTMRPPFLCAISFACIVTVRHLHFTWAEGALDDGVLWVPLALVFLLAFLSDAGSSSILYCAHRQCIIQQNLRLFACCRFTMCTTQTHIAAPESSITQNKALPEYGPGKHVSTRNKTGTHFVVRTIDKVVVVAHGAACLFDAQKMECLLAGGRAAPNGPALLVAVRAFLHDKQAIC